jgi:hypothetical protein
VKMHVVAVRSNNCSVGVIRDDPWSWLCTCRPTLLKFVEECCLICFDDFRPDQCVLDGFSIELWCDRLCDSQRSSISWSDRRSIYGPYVTNQHRPIKVEIPGNAFPALVYRAAPITSLNPVFLGYFWVFSPKSEAALPAFRVAYPYRLPMAWLLSQC